MTDTSGQIAEDLRTLGVKPGGLLLVHSSYKALGPVAGGLDAVFAGLRLALGEEGTLLFPALSYLHVGREQPVFDVRRTPSCVGILPETFRQLPGVRRSLHPTHSVCAQGPRAAELTQGHGQDRTPCGAQSPFRRLTERGGQILLLGCGLLPNTTMHTLEELAGAPYLFEPEPIEYTLIDCDGKASTAVHRRHTHFPQHYDRVRDPLLGHGLREGQVLQARCHLFEADALRDCALRMMKQDPTAFYKD